MAIVMRRRVDDHGRKYSAIYHWCPACEALHGVWVNEQRGDDAKTKWTFNGDMQKPTFNPSVRCFTTHDDEGELLPNGEQRTLCHYFVRDGAIDFCGDNPHAFNSKTRVPMPEIPANWFSED